MLYIFSYIKFQTAELDTSYEDVNEELFQLGETTIKQYGFSSHSGLWSIFRCLLVIICSTCGSAQHAVLYKSTSSGKDKPGRWCVADARSVKCRKSCAGRCELSFYIPAHIPGGGVFLRSFRKARQILKCNAASLTSIVRYTLEVRLALEQYKHTSSLVNASIEPWLATRQGKRSVLNEFIVRFPQKGFKEEVYNGVLFKTGYSRLDSLENTILSSNPSGDVDVGKYLVKFFQNKVAQQEIEEFPTRQATAPSISNVDVTRTHARDKIHPAPMTQVTRLNGYNEQLLAEKVACAEVKEAIANLANLTPAYTPSHTTTANSPSIDVDDESDSESIEVQPNTNNVGDTEIVTVAQTSQSNDRKRLATEPLMSFMHKMTKYATKLEQRRIFNLEVDEMYKELYGDFHSLDPSKI